MSKPYVICHMMTSIDGKILTANWGQNEHTKRYSKLYEEAHNSFDSDAWMCGRVTMEKDFTKGVLPEIKTVNAPIARTDFVADKAATSFAIAVDAHGKLGWTEPDISGDHVVVVLTEQIGDGYLAYLQEKGISYIFGGEYELDFATVLDKLGNLFPIKVLMLEGGGHLNGSLLNAGLIDEISQLIIPVADGTPKSPTSFEVSENLLKAPATFLQLSEVKQMDEGVVWLKYKAK